MLNSWAPVVPRGDTRSQCVAAAACLFGRYPSGRRRFFPPSLNRLYRDWCCCAMNLRGSGGRRGPLARRHMGVLVAAPAAGCAGGGPRVVRVAVLRQVCVMTLTRRGLAVLRHRGGGGGGGRRRRRRGRRPPVGSGSRGLRARARLVAPAQLRSVAMVAARGGRPGSRPIPLVPSGQNRRRVGRLRRRDALRRHHRAGRARRVERAVLNCRHCR